MTKQLKITFYFFIALLIVYFFLRLGFYFMNQEFFTDTSSSDVMWAFIYGMRFDIAGILILYSPVIILFNLPGNVIRFRFYQILLSVLFSILTVIGFILNFADYKYFPTVQRRLLFEPYTKPGDLLHLAPGIIQYYLPLLILFVVVTILFLIISFKLFHLLHHRIERRGKWVRESISFIIMIPLIVIGIRGGLQMKPLRQANAFFSAQRSIGFLTLNSTYTVLVSMFQNMLPEYHLMNDREAIERMHAMMKSNDEQFIDSNYIFLRNKNPQAPQRKLNVVIFIMESWTAQYCGSITGNKTFTPFFDSLSTQGVLCTHFVANGQRSIESVPSILSSLPGLFDQSLIGSRLEMNTYRGLGSILMEHGYTTSFFHGAELGSMGFDGFVREAGFMNYYSKEDFPILTDSVYDGAWGICDEPFFNDAAHRLSRQNNPFCATIFSLSSHDPYTIPNHRKNLFKQYARESDFERSLRYSDFSLQQFFTFAQTQSWFDSTIFIITADHTDFGTRNNFYETFHIPMLIYPLCLY